MICTAIDKQIIITARKVVMGSKTFLFVKQLFLIRQVSTYTHVRHSSNRKGQILQGGMKCIKTNNAIQQPFFFFISSIPQNNLYARMEGRLHLFDPVFRGWNTIGIREQQYLVFCRFYAHGKGKFLSWDMYCFLL